MRGSSDGTAAQLLDETRRGEHLSPQIFSKSPWVSSSPLTPLIPLGRKSVIKSRPYVEFWRELGVVWRPFGAIGGGFGTRWRDSGPDWSQIGRMPHLEWIWGGHFALGGRRWREFGARQAQRAEGIWGGTRRRRSATERAPQKVSRERLLTLSAHGAQRYVKLTSHDLDSPHVQPRS